MKDRWNSFWFASEPIYTLGLVRIVFGAVTVAWTLALLPDLYEVFGEQGVAPQPGRLDYQWSVLEIWTGDRALLICWVLLLASGLALTAGWHSRVAAVAVFVLLHSFVRRGMYIVNGGDAILCIIALIMALCSCGAALSLDQRRRTGSFWSAQTRSVWPVRLLQVQLSVIYLVTVQAKLTGRTWTEGSAVFYAWLSDGRWATLPAPEWLADNAILVNVLSWGTLAVELAIGVLVWNRHLRWWVLGAGVVMHLAIMVNLNVAFFSIAIFVLYVAFVPADTVRDMPSRIAGRWPRIAEKEPAA
jgi:hypothetical protein